MDSFDSSPQTSAVAFSTRPEKPAASMVSLRQTLVELRKQARLHDREALVACLTLAISLAKTNTTN